MNSYDYVKPKRGVFVVFLIISIHNKTAQIIWNFVGVWKRSSAAGVKMFASSETLKPKVCPNYTDFLNKGGARWAVHSVEILNLNLLLAQGKYSILLRRKQTSVRSWNTKHAALSWITQTKTQVTKVNLEMAFPPHLAAELQWNMRLPQ